MTHLYSFLFAIIQYIELIDSLIKTTMKSTPFGLFFKLKGHYNKYVFQKLLIFSNHTNEPSGGLSNSSHSFCESASRINPQV